MWPYYAPLFANFVLLFYESKCFKPIKNTNHGVARTSGNIFRFIDGLMAINDGNEFEDHYNEIYQPKLVWKEENTLHSFETLIFLQIWIKFKHSYMIKGTPTFSTFWDFRTKWVLYNQKLYAIKNSFLRQLK